VSPSCCSGALPGPVGPPGAGDGSGFAVGGFGVGVGLDPPGLSGSSVGIAIPIGLNSKMSSPMNVLFAIFYDFGLSLIAMNATAPNRPTNNIGDSPACVAPDPGSDPLGVS